MEKDPEAEAEKRYKTIYGCCCQCCSVKAEGWFFAVFDLFIIAFTFKEWPPPELPGLLWFYRSYVYGVVFPSLLAWLWALLGKGGLPRRVLCRVIIWKMIGFPLCFVVYFVILTRQDEWGPFFCDPDAEPHAINVNPFKKYGVSVEKCVTFIRIYMCFRPLIYDGIFAISLKAAYAYMRAHPENDGKGIFNDSPEYTFKPMIDQESLME
eukprot:TRINITY_DN56980_c0_g1_i1.p1 TRINITY_DN56980_c0_g1~~TRINITY_DN56980_c0_g1_i1.p1  ORF type:complete len:209 (-),score=28.69 TRINITY_DN56980_c0_g1_i1:108-734(-)